MSKGQSTGFFTFGVPADSYDLPHPSLGLPVILLIRRVLIRAFELLREQKFPLATASEDEVTDALRHVIENDLRQSGSVRGFNKRTYEFIIRQGQWENYSGDILTKTPDLCFKLRDDNGEPSRIISEFNALFVECKPVDSAHPTGGRYCDDGLIRFVRGDYAWAMQEGLMLAYVRDGRTIAKHLIPAMSEAHRMNSLATIEMPISFAIATASATGSAEAVHASRHRRAFFWRDNKGAATEICIYHFWHQCV